MVWTGPDPNRNIILVRLLIPGPCLCPEVGATVYIRQAEDVLTPQSVQETCLSQAQFKAQLSLNTKGGTSHHCFI